MSNDENSVDKVEADRFAMPAIGKVATAQVIASADTPEERDRRAKFMAEQKTKRLWLMLSVASLLVALLIVTFAPAGRETLSYWIGGGLVIFAAGSAGYKRVWGRGPKVSIGADQDKRDI